MGEKAIYEPGTLEHTRKNIGPINKEEAKKMTEVLGGEIFTEKAAPVDTSHIPKAPIKHRAPSAFAPAAVSNNNAASKTRNKGLPIITQKTRQRIDKLMMSPEYHIKPSFGLFNFIYSLQKKNKERVSPKFTGVILHKHLDHMDAFITVIKTLFEMAPSSYKQRIQNENDLKFRFMRKVSKWSTKELNLLYIDINKNIANTTIEDLVPFTREIYGMLAQILYLGEAKVSFILKEIYTDQTKFPDANKTKIASFARDAVHEWVYLYNEVV